jgi:pyruvate dehydrogenase E2 component (dihydrolipoamide acetyltransferase)
MRTGTIVSWLKKEGDPVKKDEPLATIETEKISGEVKAPDDGVLKKILKREGEEVPVGEVIAIIEKK